MLYVTDVLAVGGKLGAFRLNEFTPHPKRHTSSAAHTSEHFMRGFLNGGLGRAAYNLDRSLSIH